MRCKSRFLGVLALLLLVLQTNARVVIYPRIACNELPESKLYQVWVRPTSGGEWRKVQTFQVEVDMDTRSKAAFVQWDMDESVEVKVKFLGEPYAGGLPSSLTSQAVIRPLRHQIKPVVDADGTLVFRLDAPANLSLEVGGDRLHNLHLFAMPTEKETYTGREPGCICWQSGSKDIFRQNAKLIYFGPGVHAPKDLPSGEINISSGTTVYLAPGAVVKARLRIDKAKNIRILGRGILLNPLRGVEITHSKHIQVEGLTVVSPQHYTIYGGSSSDVSISQLKSFSSRGWTDGINLMCCSDWRIKDVFLRTSDDCLAFYNHRWWYWGGSKKLSVESSVLWADVAHAINVGGHGDDVAKKGEVIRDVSFRDIDILQVDEDDDNYRAALSICCGDQNHVRNITFEDIRIEELEEGRLIDVRVLFNPKYNTVLGGSIKKVVFSNIRYVGNESGVAPSRLQGYDATHNVEEVTLKNVSLNGRPLPLSEIEVGPFVKNLKVE